MTEQDWLTCESPRLMLDACAVGATPLLKPLSERKRRLWVEACRLLNWPTIGATAAWGDLQSTVGLDDAIYFWTSSRYGEKSLPLAKRADLLRDIVGNPWRPVEMSQQTISCEGCGGEGGWLRGDGIDTRWRDCHLCHGKGSRPGPRLGITADVLAVAQAAYDSTAEDGTLDSVRLSILADALEEAGCAEEPLLRHLRGQERCPCRDEADRITRTTDRFAVASCGDCGGNGWRSTPGSHVRGCWALDLVLGRK